MEESVVNNFPPKSSVRRSISQSDVTDSLSVPTDDREPKKTVDGIRKAVSVDSGQTDTSTAKKPLSAVGSFKRRSIRRRSSKRSRPEPEFGHDKENYEKIRERVLQERAVTNAIDALQERYRMLTFMFDDCVELDNERKDRRLKKLSVQRQFELILVISAFVLLCIPISISFIVLSR